MQSATATFKIMSRSILLAVLMQSGGGSRLIAYDSDAGANWDRRANTNFARAFDSDLLGELKRFSHSLVTGDALF